MTLPSKKPDAVLEGGRLKHKFSHSQTCVFRSIMTKAVRALILSHTIVFAAGFAAGKAINADELHLYRDAHESTATKLKRQASAVGLGALVIGTIVLVSRVAFRVSKAPSSL